MSFWMMLSLLSLLILTIMMNYDKILQILISLEVVVFLLFVVILCVYLGGGGQEIICYMVMSVIESVMGLVLLVLLVFFSGSDGMNM
uniref:NADH dehydrogenase subunit 4L n=1 Tax=Neoseiulus chebalingensis TaxID=3061192 RepID=UPI0030FE48DB